MQTVQSYRGLLFWFKILSTDIYIIIHWCLLLVHIIIGRYVGFVSCIFSYHQGLFVSLATASPTASPPSLFDVVCDCCCIGLSVNHRVQWLVGLPVAVVYSVQLFVCYPSSCKCHCQPTTLACSCLLLMNRFVYEPPLSAIERNG